jgi:hypothetical protein
MLTSSALMFRVGADSFRVVTSVTDRALRLRDGAIRNAATAVVADRVSARSRAEVATAIRSVAMDAELSLVGA